MVAQPSSLQSFIVIDQLLLILQLDHERLVPCCLVKQIMFPTLFQTQMIKFMNERDYKNWLSQSANGTVTVWWMEGVMLEFTRFTIETRICFDKCYICTNHVADHLHWMFHSEEPHPESFGGDMKLILGTLNWLTGTPVTLLSPNLNPTE